MTDETSTPETEDELALPDFLDRASPEVISIVEAGRKLSLAERMTELAKATAPATVRCEPKAGSANAMAAKPKAEESKPAPKAAKPKVATTVTGGKKSDAEMIALIKEKPKA